MRAIRRSYALIVDDGHALLVRNRAGRWGLPGGRAKRGETLEDAVKREACEEIGVKIKLRDRVSHRHIRQHREECDHCVVYEAKIKKGTPKPNGEIARVKWVSLDKVPVKLTRFRTGRMEKAIDNLG